VDDNWSLAEGPNRQSYRHAVAGRRRKRAALSHKMARFWAAERNGASWTAAMARGTASGHTIFYFGCCTVRKYGFSVLNPCGYFFFASSSDSDAGMITS